VTRISSGGSGDSSGAGQRDLDASLDVDDGDDQSMVDLELGSGADLHLSALQNVSPTSSQDKDGASALGGIHLDFTLPLNLLNGMTGASLDSNPGSRKSFELATKPASMRVFFRLLADYP